jgi:hypothetical protein
LPPMWTLSIINQLTSFVRMRRYKEERRRQSWPRMAAAINHLTSVVRMRRFKVERRRKLAFHVDIIHNQSVNTGLRMRRYKEEQLAFHVDIINNQSVNLCCAHAQVQGGAEAPAGRPCGDQADQQRLLQRRGGGGQAILH